MCIPKELVTCWLHASKKNAWLSGSDGVRESLEDRHGNFWLIVTMKLFVNNENGVQVNLVILNHSCQTGAMKETDINWNV